MTENNRSKTKVVMMSNLSCLRVLIAGGGTGGHLFPGLAVARALLSRSSDIQVSFVGSLQGIEARTVPQEGFEIDFIRSSGLRGKSSFVQIRGLLRLLPSLWEAWQIVRRRQPNVVVGVGGYSSGPVVLAAVLQGNQTLVLEQNAIPGMTNRLLSRVVCAVAVNYKETCSYFGSKSFVSGNPVRQEFFSVREDDKVHRRSIKPRNTSLLIFGGSQGAHVLNVAVKDALPELKKLNLEITHQTGEHDLSSVRDAYLKAGMRARVEPFLPRMADAMLAADLIICRAGATTLAELAAIGRAAVLVPLRIATDDHQRYNAEILERASAAKILDERLLSGASLVNVISELIKNPERLKQMGKTMSSFAVPDAAEIIVDRIFALANE